MRNRSVALLLALALVLAALAGLSAAAEGTTVKLSLGLKETYQIDASSVPNAAGETLAYKSSNPKVATVNSSGRITAKKKGTARIGVGYGSTLLVTYAVTVLDAPKKVTLSDKKLVLYAGDVKALKATLPKKTASALTYKSSAEGVVTVDADGKVTAVVPGKATVTVKTFKKNVAASCAVTVLAGKAPTTLGVNASNLALQVGESFKLVPAVDEGSEAVYSYATKNKKTATVSSAGAVKGVKKGKTKITVTTQNGLSKTVNVAVIKKLKLTEASGYLTGSADAYAANVKKLKLKKDEDATFQGTMYYNDQLALILTADSCELDLNPASTPKYSLQGVAMYMSVEQAAAKLIEKGWTQTGTTASDGTETRAFAKAGDTARTIELSTNDGTSLLGIKATLKF